MSNLSTTPPNNRRRAYAGASHAVLLGAVLAMAGFVTGSARADEPVVLGPLKVEDKSDKNNQKHDTGLSVLPSTIQDTPQSINVIGQEQLKAQAVTSLEGALKNVPGITIAIGEGGTLAGDQFKIRGFDAKDDVYLDGLRDFGAYTRDSFNYEEVQVLKGPSGALFGRGTGGGAVNVISKHPTLETAADLDVFVGNGDYYRTLADVNYVIGDSAAIRITGMLAHTGVVDRDVVKSDRWGIAPSIAFGIGTDLNFTLSYFHQHDDRIPDYGLVVAQNPAGGNVIAEPVSEYGVPRSTFTGYNTDRDNQATDMLTARLNYKANDWLTLSNDARYGLYGRYFQYTTVDRCDFLPAGTAGGTNNCSGVIFGPTPHNALGGIGGGGPYNQNAWGVQDIATARADFNVGGLRNQLIGGLDWSIQDNDKLFYAYQLPPLASGIYTIGNNTRARNNIGISLFNPTHTPPDGYTVFLPTLATIAGSSATATTILSSTGNATDYAGFLTDRLWFSDAWSVIGGFRYDEYVASFNSTQVNLVEIPLKTKNSLLSPHASLVFEPTEDQTYYVSWGRALTPQGTSIVGAATAVTANLANLKPEKSETFEVGAKIGLFDGALGLSGSLFSVLKSNSLRFDPSGSGDIDAQSGERDRVNGFELSATGQINDDWTLNAGYTFLDSKITYDLSCTTPPAALNCLPNPFTMGKPVIFVPKNAASFWTTYDLHDVVSGLSAGGGMTYQDAMNVRYTTTGAAPNPTAITRIARIPKTLTFDAYAAYQLDNVRLALNVQNLFDDLYYTQSFGNRGTPAPGRTFIFSVSWTPDL